MSDEQTVKTYAAKRRLKMRAAEWREPGELFPEGHLMNRIDSNVHTGRVREVEVPVSEFKAAVEKYILAEHQRHQVYARTGLVEGTVLRGPHRTPGPAQPLVAVTVPPADVPAATRIQGPVKPAAKKLPTKRVPAKKAARKTVPRPRATKTTHAKLSDKAQLVPQRKLTSE